MKKSIGKNTLGGGNKMNVDLKTYNRSTHNLSYAWRSSMGVGGLTPFMKIVALPGDTFDINLDTLVFTHPTIGPLFGTYKLQLDIFQVPMRLYIAQLHNNALNVGLNMKEVKIPKIKAENATTQTLPTPNVPEWTQISPSSIMSYLGLKNWGLWDNSQSTNALPLLSYIDIFKNYYANKQEENFYAIMPTRTDINSNYSGGANGVWKEGATITIETSVIDGSAFGVWMRPDGTRETYNMDTATAWFSKDVSGTNTVYTIIGTPIDGEALKWVKAQSGNATGRKAYPLSELDDLREYLLQQGKKQVLFNENTTVCQYIKDLLSINANGEFNTRGIMSGLIMKTYQSDKFNNWINTEWIDGENGINAITAIDTSSGSFSIDTLNLSRKVYDMLNRIAVSGGTYKDWIDTVYTSGYELHAETPIYEGGMSAEIEFEQVVSNSATENEPLGTLAGRGVINGKSVKGGKLHIKVKEPSYIMGIVSITPRVDYCQGQDWDTRLDTLDDLHKPALDGIGFQDLEVNEFASWVKPDIAVGKQPAWINYMTAVNKVFGNFAIKDNEQFMCLVKRFEPKWNGTTMNTEEVDVSSYIEPELYNYIFADTTIEAQNFWVQIGCGIEARRVMSAKQIPNL